MESLDYASRSHQEKASWYSPAAEAYVRARPLYPPALIAAVCAAGRLGHDTRVLEIGSGPGTATREFVPIVAEIVCVEPNGDFVALARNVVGGSSKVSFVTENFEHAEVSGSFDAVIAATSFHWISADQGVTRIKGLLRHGGHVILLWNKEPHPIAEQADAVAEAFRLASFPMTGTASSRNEAVKLLASLSAPLADQGFDELLLGHAETQLRYDIETFIALHQSFSPYLALTVTKQERVTDELRRHLPKLIGNNIDTTYVSVGHVFRYG
jgi:SAM-dependent methyltransferase